MARKLFLVICICLSFGNLLPTIVWEECVKLPELYHHYLLHQEEEDHSFFDFLAEHYGENGDHHAQHHDHAKIPFKAPHTSTDSGWNHNYLPASVAWSGSFHLPFSLGLETKFHYALASPLEPLLSFWQPPKL